MCVRVCVSRWAFSTLVSKKTAILALLMRQNQHTVYDVPNAFATDTKKRDGVGVWLYIRNKDMQLWSGENENECRCMRGSMSMSICVRGCN